MAITKKKTSDCKTIDSNRIIGTFVHDNQGYVQFINTKVQREVALPVTKEEYAHISSGAGTTVDAFDNGLSKAFRYQFLLCTEKDDASGHDTVVAVHSAPISSYMMCDWSTELQRHIPEGGVLCTIRENGGIDINTFPSNFEYVLPGVLGKLAGLESVSNTTAFTVDDVTVKVRSIDGSECMLMLKKKHKK